MVRVLGSTLLLLLLTGASSGAPRLDFREVGVSRSFEAEIITEVFRDRVGLLWIGTREALYLHDGQRFRKFQHEVGHPESLTSSAVRTVHEDALGRLWIGTNTGGLNLLDRARWSFQHFRHDPANPASIDDGGVFALADAEGGQLWVGTASGLSLLDPGTGRASRTPLLPGGGDEFVMTLHREGSGTLWAGTVGRGLFRRRAGESSFERVPAETGGRAAQDIFSLAPDEAGGLWVGARDGLYRWEPGAGHLRRVALSDTLINVTELEPDGEGTLWIGTYGQGLYRLDTATGRMTAEETPLRGAGAQYIDQGALALDAQRGLFVGTFGAGLVRASLHPPVLQRVDTVDPEGAGALALGDIYAVLPDGDGRLLLGNYGDGVATLTVATGVVEPLVVPASKGEQVNGVLSLLRTREGTIWAGVSDGSWRFDPATGDFRFYRRGLGEGEGRAPGFVYSLLQDSRGRVWLGSGGGGLYRYQPETDDFVVFRHSAADPRSIPDDFVTVLMEDRRGRLWVGTRSGGAGFCTVEEETLECTRLSPGGSPGLSHHHVGALLEDPSGAVWIGTVGGGLQRVVPDAGGGIPDVARWTRGEGLIDDHVVALARSPDGALWVSTRAGLSRFDEASGHFESYAASDGLPTVVFNAKAVALDGGRLYWGTRKGVVALDPSVRPQRGPTPPLIITSIEGMEARPDRPVWELTSLEVPWAQPFSLEFAVLDFSRGDAEYAYRLTADGAWLPLGSRSQLTFHALPPGDYQLSIRGRAPGRDWGETRPLALRVTPPFWRRGEVHFGALVLLMLGVVAGLGWRTRDLQRRNRALRELQAEREQALAEARTSRDGLREAFARLRRLTMRLEAAKEQERKHLAQELHDEFGQALTAVKINLGLVAAAGRAAGPGMDRLAETISLVDRLIGQVRALSIDLRPPMLDEIGLVPALEGYLRGVRQRGGVGIGFDAAPDLPVLGAERDIVLFRVIQEAVTNALRHAGARHIDVRLEPAGEAVRLEVRDDGKGFAPESVLAGGASRGFGLFGMQERVRDLGGRFEVTSRPGEGTSVVAEVPLAEEEEHRARTAGG
ncbi:ligand-binding sensor domain-containing protein [Archangium violaceum]|uniref:ligand-binding sensor domain-containing protein n=1 Tax=Archangium violaceum TaxID=83451 RepID=UPI001EF48EA2|nr:sensor histidine kinase [Archangium violaceum]